MQINGRVKAVLCIALALPLALGVYFLLKARAPESVPPSTTAHHFAEWESSTGSEVSAPVIPPGATTEDIKKLTATTDFADSLAGSLRDLAGQPGVVPGELMLKFRFASDIASLRSRAGSLGLTVLWSDSRLNSARIAYTDADALANELQTNREAYEDIGPNFVMRIPGLPAEPELDSENPGGTVPVRESLMETLGADQDRSQWGAGVTVAILDSGVLDHPSLEKVEVTRVDLSQSDEINGHGTAMASLVAGRVYPAEGIAPATSLLDVRITDANGVSNTGLVAEGILRASDQGADVINISMGAFGDASVLRAAVEYAQERNIVVVAAAGNEQVTQIAFPAAYPGVISVGAVDAENTQAYFSNSGETLSISAPGVGIFSAYKEGQLVVGSGTSQATAITSGVVASLLSRGYQAREILPVLEEHAFQTGAPREQIGAGVIRVP